jgi:hypothetical protein
MLSYKLRTFWILTNKVKCILEIETLLPELELKRVRYALICSF